MRPFESARRVKIKLSNLQKWHNNLNLVKQYININNKLPSYKDDNKQIRSLYYWIADQKKNYKNNHSIMNNNNIRILYENFRNTYL